MIKDIIVNLSLGGQHDVAGEFAASVAAAFDAHLAGVAFRLQFEMPGTIIGSSVAAGIIEAQRRESDRVVGEAVTRFERAVKLAGVQHEIVTPEASLATAAERFSRASRHYDLVVVRQADPDKPGPEEIIAEGALFSGGRPVIVVPYIQKEGLKLDRVTVCWDGSRAAARAVADALPLLQKSKYVELLMVLAKGAPAGETPGVDMAQHLARHGLRVELERLVVPNMNVAEAILSHIADRSSDLLVMGGYGHSRLREFVLGGVTREIMKSMTIPALMSH
jgi:nucleotide-binding universal stress UspA family protein